MTFRPISASERAGQLHAGGASPYDREGESFPFAGGDSSSFSLLK